MTNTQLNSLLNLESARRALQLGRDPAPVGQHAECFSFHRGKFAGATKQHRASLDPQL